jgi:hypothetical protein
MALTVKYVCKAFSEESHARSFLGGHVRITKLKDFTEAEEKTGRRDLHEAVHAIYKKPTIVIIREGMEPIILPPEDMVGPVRVTRNSDLGLYVFCLVAGILDESEQMTLTEQKSKLDLHEKCKAFGDWLVVLSNWCEFLERLRVAAVTASCRMDRRGLVKYYDSDETNGAFDDELVPFRKEIAFSGEREYRIVFRSDRPERPSPLYLKMPSISDIAFLTRTSEFNSLLEVR